MAFEGWLSFAGQELINNVRTASYSSIAVPCADCAGLRESLGDAPYTNPAGDENTGELPAPWFDLGEPASKDFWGFVGLEFAGSSTGTAERQWTELLGNGGVSGALRRSSREVEVRALAFAASAEALSWGIAWLASALRGSHCQSGCSGDELCIYAACPQPRLVPDPEAESADPCLGSGGLMPDPEWDPETGGDELVRSLFDVSLIEGPAQESKREVIGGWISQVTFTLKAGSPFWYRIPAEVHDSTEGDPSYRDTIPDYDIMTSADCPEPVDCMDNSPYCGPQDSPWGDEPFPGSDPSNPGVLLDPCYPTSPFLAQRAIFTIPPGITPGWLEKVPLITVYSGTTDLHRVTVRWYMNPQGRTPGPDLDPCTACTELTVPWIPAETVMTLDGRVEEAFVNCAGSGITTSGVTLYGPRGDLFSWPVFDCATPLFVELLAQQTSLNRDMWYTLDMVARQDTT